MRIFKPIKFPGYSENLRFNYFPVKRKKIQMLFNLGKYNVTKNEIVQ